MFSEQNKLKNRNGALDWRSILRSSAQKVYKDDELNRFPLEYNPLPDKSIQKKIDFFFLPYNYE
jgi:hypothetical protein